MKVKKKIGLLTSLFAAMSLSFGIGVHTLSAKAESTNESGATIYTSSEKDYWMITDGSGDYTVSLDNAARMQSAYKGVETVVTPVEGVGDIGITLKGMVNPMANLIVKHDNQVSGQADANAIVYTFTSLSDPDRQISIIATNRYNRSWYTFAFTDELEVKDGFTYIEGTEQKTIGYKDLSAYNDIGYCYWFAGEKEWGAIYQGALTFHLGTDGSVYYNNNSVIGSVADEAFLTASKTQLSGTKYEERYTSEWIAETLTQLAKGARMELKWYDVQTEQLDFHIRGISGSWIGDNGGNGLEYNLGLKHSTIIYKKTNTLYVGETYKLSDLVYGGGFSFRNAQNTSAPLSLSGWYANSANKTAGNNGDSTWYNGLTQMNKTITLTETGTYNMTLAGSFLGYFHSTDFPTNFTFDVLAPTAPSVTAQSDVSLIGKQTYDLSAFFTLENADGATVVYTVDGTETENYTSYTADGKDHVIVCTVSDNFGQSASATVNATGVWVGDTFFTASSGTVDYCTGKASTSGGNSGVRTEVTGVTDSTLTLTYNQTLSAGLGSGDMFAFDKYTDAEGNSVAVADMIVITYTSLSDPTKQLSVINRNNKSGYNNTTLAFTDDVEYGSDGNVYIKGTKQATVGLRFSDYNNIGYAQEGGPIFGAAYYFIDIESDGTIQHNQYGIYGNILNESFLSASRAKLSADNPYYERYTSEWAQSVLTAITTDKCMMTVSYYGLNEARTEKTIGFNISQLNNQWLGTSSSTFTTTYPYIYPKTTTLYVGESYTIGELVNVYSVYRVNGKVTATMEGWTDANNIGNDTYVNNSTVFTKTFTPNATGTWSIKVTTRCAPSEQAWLDGYLTQTVTFKVAYRLNVEIDGKTTTENVTDSTYTLPTAKKDGEVFLGWKYNGALYAAGDTIDVTAHDGTVTAVFMSFETPDFASARIAVNSGLRFTTYMSKDTYEWLKDSGVSYSLYTLITSTHSTKSVRIDIDLEKIYYDAESNSYCFYSAIVDIKPKNTARIYYAESYLVLNYADGGNATIKTETIENRQGRSYAYIMEAARNDYADAPDAQYCHEITVNGTTKYAPVTADTYAKICAIYENLQQNSVQPYVTIYRDGTDVTAEYKSAIDTWFTENPVHIGDTVDATEWDTVFDDGWTVDESQGVTSGTMSVTGLDLVIYLKEDNFVTEGVSEYSVVYGSDVNVFVANEVASYVQAVTGATLPVTADNGSYDESAKVVSLGKTSYQKKNKSSVDYATLKTDGFVIQRVNHNYIIDSATTDGVLYGAYHFVSKMLGVEFLTNKETYIPLESTIRNQYLDITEIPDFAIRDYYAYDVWQYASTSAKFGMNSSSLLTDSRISGSNYNYDYYGYYYGEETNSKYGGQVYTPSATREGHTVQYLLMADAYLNGVTSSYAEVNTEKGSEWWPIGYYGEHQNWYAWDPNYTERVNGKYGDNRVTSSTVRINDDGYSQEEICWTNGLTKNSDGSLSYVAGSDDAKGSVIEKLVEICVKMIDDSKNADSKYIMLGFADYYSECQCGSEQKTGTKDVLFWEKDVYETKDGLCTHGYEYYGGFGGVVANTVNEIAKAVKAQRPSSDAVFVTFAYSKGIEVPKNLTLREDVAVKIAYRNCVSHALNDTSCTCNDELRTKVVGWDNILAENGQMLVWDYSVNFSDYLYYMPNYDAMKANYRYYRDELNTQHVLTQGCPGEYNFYEHHLHLYVSTKLMWNADLDVDEVIEKFDALYFGNYASYVAAYREIMDNMYEAKSIHVSTTDSLNYKDASTYDATALLSACAKLQEAIDAVNADAGLTETEKNTLITRLRSVKITPQYMLLDLGLSTDSDLISDFFDSIEILGLTKRNESGETFADMKTSFNA